MSAEMQEGLHVKCILIQSDMS